MQRKHAPEHAQRQLERSLLVRRQHQAQRAHAVHRLAVASSRVQHRQRAQQAPQRLRSGVLQRQPRAPNVLVDLLLRSLGKQRVCAAAQVRVAQSEGVQGAARGRGAGGGGVEGGPQRRRHSPPGEPLQGGCALQGRQRGGDARPGGLQRCGGGC